MDTFETGFKKKKPLAIWGNGLAVESASPSTVDTDRLTAVQAVKLSQCKLALIDPPIKTETVSAGIAEFTFDDVCIIPGFGTQIDGGDQTPTAPIKESSIAKDMANQDITQSAILTPKERNSKAFHILASSLGGDNQIITAVCGVWVPIDASTNVKTTFYNKVEGANGLEVTVSLFTARSREFKNFVASNLESRLHQKNLTK